MTSTAHAVHRLRTIALLTILCTCLALTVIPMPAMAVGTQGVDLQPLLPRRDGLLTGTVDPETPIRFLLVNETVEPRTVTVTVSAATVDDAGAYGLGGAIDWIDIDREGDITLGPEETLELTATADVEAFREAQAPLIALVLDVQGGGNVVTQAATVIRLVDGGSTLPVPLGLLLLAIALLALSITAYVRISRQVNGSVIPGRADTPTPG